MAGAACLLPPERVNVSIVAENRLPRFHNLRADRLPASCMCGRHLEKGACHV